MTQHSLVTTRLKMGFQHSSGALKPKSKYYMSLKDAREHGGAVVRRVLLYIELTPSATRRDGDDMIVNFRVAGVWTVQEWSHNMIDTKILEFSMDSQIYNQLHLKYLYLSLHRVRLLTQGCTLYMYGGMKALWQ
jgi:hypothetical protein